MKMKQIIVLLILFTSAIGLSQNIQVDTIGINEAGQVIILVTTKDTLINGNIVRVERSGLLIDIKEENRSKIKEINIERQYLRLRLDELKREKDLLKIIYGLNDDGD